MGYRLHDFIDVPKFQEMLDALNETLNCANAIIDNESNVLTASGWQDICTKFHRINPDTEQQCRQSDLYILEHANEGDPSITYKCPMGLLDAATPIVIDGKHLGNVFIGQLFLEKPDIEFFRNQAKTYGFDEEAYLDAVSKVPVLTREQLDQNLAFIRSIAEILGETGLSRMKELEITGAMQEYQERLEDLVSERTVALKAINDQLRAEIVERKQTEERLFKEMDRGQRLLKLYDTAHELTDKNLYDYALDEAVHLTNSTIGFFHLVSDDQKNIILTTWNSEALKNCAAASYATHYPIEQAGNWVDCVSFRHPVVYNDYSVSPNQKGLPEGHTPLLRFMSIPVFEDNKVKYIVGVGNKPEEYGNHDVIQIQLVANELQNIIKQRRSEVELRQAGAYNRSLIEASLDPLVTIGPDGRITDVNAATEVATGYPRDVLLGTDFSFYFTEPEKARTGYQQAFEEGQIRDYPLEIIHRDRHATPVLYNASVYRDEAGKAIGVFAAARDVSQQKRAEDEIRKLYAELEQRVIERTAQLEAANKELEAFAYSVSHDLLAPLRSIDGFSQMLLDDYAEKLDEQGQDSLRRVRAASRRMAQLIDDMLRLSRIMREEMALETVDLSMLTRSVMDEMRKGEPKRQAEFVVMDGLITCGDPHLLRAMLENLIGNAWKFTARHETARIEFGLTTTGDKPTYYVRDNGAGFDMAYADKLFVPFQRLHAYNEFAGTGIGLSIVQRIIHRHGGEVWAEGAPEHGATFYFTL
jgi:PAS domain S-box-containing protein